MAAPIRVPAVRVPRQSATPLSGQPWQRLPLLAGVQGAAVAALLATACTTSGPAAGGGSAGPEAPRTASVPTTAAPSFPADATFADGATATILLPRVKGNVFVAVTTERNPAGPKTTLHVTREEGCHVDGPDASAQLFVCTTVYDRRKPLPAGAFTFDGTLGTATLSTTLEGKPLHMTWTGYGAVRRKVNQNGNLLVETRDAKATTTWGSVRQADKDDAEVPSSIYRRVTARTP